MTDDEAIKLMIEGAFQSEEEARAKLIRAPAHDGQEYLSYVTAG